MNGPTLPPELIRVMNEHLDALKAAQRAGSHVDAQYLVDAWASFVDEAATYRLSIYDYTNDLDARNLLEDCVAAISPELTAQLMVILAPLDSRFFNNTKPALRSFRPEETLAALPASEREALVEQMADVMHSLAADSETQAVVAGYLSELKAGRAAPRPWNTRIPREPDPELLEDLVEGGHVRR